MHDKMLFHVSEEAGIELFEPRWSENADNKVVWAIDADHLRSYLLPRECPRVTYYAGPQTASADVEQLLVHAHITCDEERSEQRRSPVYDCRERI